MLDACGRDPKVAALFLDPDEAQMLEHRGAAGRSAAGERIEHRAAIRSDEPNEVLHQRDGLDRRVIVEAALRALAIAETCQKAGLTAADTARSRKSRVACVGRRLLGIAKSS